MSARWIALGMMLLVAACDDGAPPPPDAPDVFVDESGPLFAPDHVLQVDISLPVTDWDALRKQTRSIGQLFSSCLLEPFDDPFTYFPGSVTIDGTRFETTGVRKKGFLGSLDTEKPSLKLKLDEYVAGQQLLGLKTITLNNSKQDPSFVRQCIAYQTFAAAGMFAPRCNFAHVRVNGTDLGLYVHVEAANKHFLRRTYGDPSGNLYEGTLSDFRRGWTATFDLKTNEAVNDRSDLEAVIAALELPDDQVLAALEPIVDVDQFIMFWATEVLVSHWDGYAGNANNFYAYHDPTSGKFQFIPWGTDSTLSSAGNPFGAGGTTSVQAQSLLARRLYLLPATRDRYVAQMRALLETAWSEPALLAELDRMQALIEPIADPAGDRGLVAAIDGVRAYVRGRRAVITTELASGPAPWTAQLREPPCFEPLGSVAGTFATTWGTKGRPDVFAAGTGTLTGALNGVAIQPLQVGSTAGHDNDQAPPKAQIALVGWMPDNTARLVVFNIAPTLIGPSRDLVIDLTTVFGVVINYTPATAAFELVGLVSDGTLHLDQASMIDGAPVTGSFTGNVVKSPF